MLDPTYSGKTMAGFVERARNGAGGGAERSLLFFHTGGTPAIFAYEKDLVAAMEKSGNAG